MKNLPESVRKVRSTPEFSEETVPDGLLNAHQTKEGTWGQIVVVEGKLEYSISEPEETIVLDSQTLGIIEPSVFHHVKPMGAVRFYVEFYE